MSSMQECFEWVYWRTCSTMSSASLYNARSLSSVSSSVFHIPLPLASRSRRITFLNASGLDFWSFLATSSSSCCLARISANFYSSAARSAFCSNSIWSCSACFSAAILFYSAFSWLAILASASLFSAVILSASALFSLAIRSDSTFAESS